MECLDVDKLDPTIFNDVCVATDFLQNVTAFAIVQAALKTCCRSNNAFTTDDDCYTYCNITTPFDTVMLNNCLLDTLDPDTSDSINFDCYPFAWELSSTMDTTAGKIATTWTYPDQTVTVTETDGSVKTETFDYSGNLLTGTGVSPGSTVAKTTGTAQTTSPGSTAANPAGTLQTTSPGSTATKTTSPLQTTSAPTTGTGSTSTTASPTSSKSSGARGIRLSYKTGVLVVLSLLRLVL